MQKLQLFLLLFLIMISFVACQPERESLLHGSWQATALTEQADSLAVNLADIGFTFYEHGRYEYRSTLAYRESGLYRLQGPFLISQDTLVGSAKEKAVEVLQLTADSLQLKMLDNDQERLLLLTKQ